MLETRTSIWHLAAISVTVDSLQCYYCAASGAGSRCEEPQTYIKARKEWFELTQKANKTKEETTDGNKIEGELTPPAELKNCTAPYDKSCSIEAFYDRGGYILISIDASELTFAPT